MILQALKEYYDRKAVNGGIAPEGWIQGGIDFLIIIDKSGNYQDVADLREFVGRKKYPKMMQVPNIGNQSLKHSNSGKDANLLWDNSSFVFGLGKNGVQQVKCMLSAIDCWLENVNDEGIDAVRKFLFKGIESQDHFTPILSHSVFGELISEGRSKVSFKVLGTPYNIVFDSPIVKSTLVSNKSNEDVEKKIPIGICLVTGKQNVPIELTHPVIKGVWGSQTSGACIVSFNKDKPSFESFLKEQSNNAPVSKFVASEYSKSLNHLLQSTQCLHIGDASTVFWAEKKTFFETNFSIYFSEPDKDNPDEGTRKIKSLYESINNGAFVNVESVNKFYVLGLAPNAARISIRFWQVGTVAEFANKIKLHFDDLAIIKQPKEPEFYSLWRLLVNVATQDKSENIPPNIGGDFMRSILTGAPYPATLLQAALRRIHSDTEKRVKPIRAALIKAYLNRYYRVHTNTNHKEISMSLDTSQPSIGYHLGRLFATLEKIQEEANPGLNATIRERFYGSACASPVTVFANLMRLKNHHLAKMVSKGRVVNFEHLLGEIVGKLNDFPAHLDLHEQGRFAIGYYHQRQDFFTKKEDLPTNI
jgi:CRISPR-associated protein Csd1